jgi:cytosine deaminase
MGIDAGIIGVGRPADLMILEAWSLDQVIARPQSDRIILRRGAFANRPLPSYRELPTSGFRSLPARWSRTEGH